MPRRQYTPTHLRAWRELRQMTQPALAEAVGVSVQTISAIERGARPYTQAFLEAAAQHLLCSVTD
ncbi:MAG: helix-turn-helix domain-containing protein, partial [Planctomycetia bacterium]